MSTITRRTISTTVMQKFKLDELDTKLRQYPIDPKPGHTLLIGRGGEPEAIGIFVKSEDDAKTYINFKLVNKDTTKSIVRACTFSFSPGRGSPKYITVEEASDQNKGWLDHDGYLTLEVTVSEPVHNNRIEAKSDLLENLLAYLKTEQNLIVCSGDGKEYKMNEKIFACHSELLATHLRNKDNGKVVFKSVLSDVMDEFIFYLDNGSIKQSAESVAFDLAELAHMYELRRLFDLVEPLLVDQVRSGQLSRVMKIAKQFTSKALFEAIGDIAKVCEEHLSEESDDFTVEVHGETLSINQAFLVLKHPHLDSRKDAIITALQGTTLQAAKGLIGFLKTSQVDDLSECLFEYASLASTLQLLGLSRIVEKEIIANPSKYDRAKVEDLAEAMKSVKIFRALAALL